MRNISEKVYVGSIKRARSEKARDRKKKRSPGIQPGRLGWQAVAVVGAVVSVVNYEITNCLMTESRKYLTK